MQKSDFTTDGFTDFESLGTVLMAQNSRQAATMSPDSYCLLQLGRALLLRVREALELIVAPYSSKNFPLRGGIGARRIMRSTWPGYLIA